MQKNTWQNFPFYLTILEFIYIYIDMYMNWRRAIRLISVETPLKEWNAEKCENAYVM